MNRRGVSGRWLAAALGFALMALQIPAWGVDWSTIEGKDIELFYPGQSAWEWILVQTDHSGAKKLREGKACRECHDGEQEDIGNLIVSGEKLEPDPIPDKPGTIKLNVKSAHDTDNLYLRLHWQNGDGGGERMDPKHQAKITVMLNPFTFTAVQLAGCWTTCHNDAQTMPNAEPGSKLTKYLIASRTKASRSGGGENYKPQADRDTLLADGQFMEYWQARLN
ncbi:MAG: ethylbenzene dehydrogenase-related protein, partial [Gammaproteobacteria bacterium]